MGRLVPADELPNSLLDADLRTEPELAPGAPQVRIGEPHVTRLIGVALDAHCAPHRASDHFDQPVESHTRPAADVDRLRNTAGPGRSVHSTAARTPSTQSVI